MDDFVHGITSGTLASKPQYSSISPTGEKSVNRKKFKKFDSFRNHTKLLLLRCRATMLILTASFGLSLSYMSFHMLLKPGLETLLSKFEPASCKILRSSRVIGRYNCSWSSCVAGCTQDILYSCWHVFVYVERSETQKKNDEGNSSLMEGQFGNVIDDLLPRSIDNLTNLYLNTSGVEEFVIFNEEGVARLQVNAQGCGYESCSDWFGKYSKIGHAFACFISHDGLIAVHEVDNNMAYFLVVLGCLPLILGLISAFFIYGLYCRKGATDTTLDLETNPETVKQRQEEARLKLIKKLSEKSETPQMDLRFLMSLTQKTMQTQQDEVSEDPPPTTMLNGWTRKVKSSKIVGRWKRAVRNITEASLLDGTPSSSTYEINTIHIPVQQEGV